MATSVDTKETTSLIASDKVDGTAVYGSDEQKIGSIEHLMIDKISGKVAYAVLTFGGFMSFGEDFYPIPWSTLEYDTNLGGYRLDVTKEQLKNAPKYTENMGWNWNRQNDETVHNYYMAPPYWSQLT
jgi:PRC-barrel domain